MTDTTLRDLAKAVVADPNDITARRALGEACHCANLSERAAWLLTALDAADAQGYARAMGEVVERCEAGMSHHGGYLSPRSRGVYHAFEDVADWARERLPAAAERD